MSLETFETPALIKAASKGNIACVKRMIEEKIRQERWHKGPYEALSYAAMHGHNNVVRYLLYRGIDPNQHLSKCTALDEALKNGHESTARSLIRRGALTGKCELPTEAGELLDTLREEIVVARKNAFFHFRGRGELGKGSGLPAELCSVVCDYLGSLPAAAPAAANAGLVQALSEDFIPWSGPDPVIPDSK